MKFISAITIALSFFVCSVFSMEQETSTISKYDLNDQLLIALQNNPDPIIIEELLQQGANPNAQNTQGEPALYLAFMTFANQTIFRPETLDYFYTIIQSLLSHGADANAGPIQPLQIAIQTFMPEKIIDLLLKYNPKNLNDALITAAFYYSNTYYDIDPEQIPNPLRYNLQKKIIFKLLDAGADPQVQNEEGQSIQSLIPDVIAEHNNLKKVKPSGR